MSEPIILYDLASKGKNTCFSPNTWKARSSLNYKNLLYKTVWMEYPNIASEFKALGIPPNNPDECVFAHSCPAVKMPDGSYVMESRHIATALEKFQPTPSLHLDSGYPERAQSAIDKLLFAFGLPNMYRIPDMLLEGDGVEWYYAEREKLFGRSLTELATSEYAGENSWTNAQPGIDELKALLGENVDGPFCQGAQPGFADLIVVSFMTLMKKIDRDGDLYSRFMGQDKSFVELWNACQKWFERDDH